MALLQNNRPTHAREKVILAVAALLGIGAGLVIGLPAEPEPEVIPVELGVQVQSRELPVFHGLSFKRRDGHTMDVKVIVRAGDKQHVGVVALPEQHRSVQTRVVDGILHIQLAKNLPDSGGLRIQVASPRLESIRMDGVSSVQVNGGLRNTVLKLEASRGAQITALRLGSRQLNVQADRGGRVHIGGRTQMLRATANSGVIEARTLSASIAKVSSVERSRVEVDAEETLEAFARDRASILYRAEPRRLLRDLDPSSRLQML